MTLSGRVRYAFHALAIDERRKPFTPTLWQQPAEDQGKNWLEQAWFSGVHSNVGGGYADAGVSDITLKWMIEHAQLAGLEFIPAFVARLKPNHLGKVYDSLDGPMKALGEYTRVLDEMRTREEDGQSSNTRTWEYVHHTAKQRHDETLASPNEWDPENFAQYSARKTPEPQFFDYLPRTHNWPIEQLQH